MSTFLEIITSGAVINFLLVVLGGIIGFFLKKGLPERLRDTIMKGMALCVMYIGVTGLFGSDVNVLIVVISSGVGALLGELINLDKLVNMLGTKIENRFNKGGGETRIAEGFVSATLLFCVGAMTIVGSIQSGILGDNTVLYSKSVIDCIAAVVLASTLGIGVALSSVAVLIIEGGLTLLATLVEPILDDRIITHMSIIGSMLIIGIALNMLGLTKIKVMNLVPAIFIPILLCQFM